MTPHHDYRPDIDGLRAISILFVLVYHFFPRFLPGGFVGVDIFFVISGYLITGIILHGLQNGHHSYLVFYSRRIKRIFPALSLVLVACLISGWLFLLPEEWRQLGKHVFGGSAFISNLLFMREGGYFAALPNSKPLLHLWSLGIEEQFYITWPLFLALMWKRPNCILPLIITFGCISFLANMPFLGLGSATLFYFPITRYWELLIGAFLATRKCFSPRLVSSGRLLPQLFERIAQPKILALLGVVLLLGALAMARDDGHFPGYEALLPTGAAYCLIAAGPFAWFNRVVLSRPCMVFIGLISYPLYLWHWPVLVFTNLIAAESVGWPAQLLALASLALSFWTYKFWESPIRNHRSSAVVTVSLAFFVGITGMAGLLIYRGAIATRLSTPANQRILAALGDWNYPFGSNFLRGSGYQVGIVKGSSKGQVVFFGDSHMEQYYPRVKLLSERGSGDFPSSVFITAGGCPPLPGVNPVSPGYACDSFFQFALQYAQRPDVRTVVFGGYWEWYFGRQYDRTPKELTAGRICRTGDAKRDPLDLGMAATEVVFRDFEKSIRVLIEQGKNVFVLLSNPTDEAYDPRTMISRLTNTVRFRNVNRDEFVEAIRPIVDRVRLAAERGGATVIDPVPYICGGSVCRNTTPDGRPLYKDSHHLRASYAAEAAVFMDRVFEPERTTTISSKAVARSSLRRR